MFKIGISEVGMYVPDLVVDNHDLEKIVETNDEWIYSRTGIKSRRISKGENTSDLAIKSVAKMNYKDVDLIILATFTPDKLAPATASIIQKKLGIENASCLDINAGCTGFIYAFKIAVAMINSNMHKKVLVIGSEVISKVVNWEDRSTCVLFGDGAGSMILEASDKPVYSIYTNSIADSDDCLYVDGITIDTPFYNEEFNQQYLSMDGTKVFKFAKAVVEDAIVKCLEDANLSILDIDLIIPHQANERIIKSVCKQMDIPFEKFYMNIDKYGNTSSASIPIALYEAVNEGKLQRGNKVILVGFGAGLTWGAVILEY